MPIALMPIPKQQFIGANGSPLAGGKVYTYSPGTTTAKASYTTSAGDVANANPVILDSAGRASIWLNGLYKISVYDANDVLQYTQDNVSAIFGNAPLAGVSAMTNLTAPANLDADTVSTAELADIVGNLIAKLRTLGVVGD